MSNRGHGEGSIYHRNDGRWAASISLAGGKRKTFYGKTRKEVQEQLKVALREQQLGTLMSGPQQTIEHFVNSWLESRRTALRIRSYERYEELARLHIVPGIGNHALQKLMPQQIQVFYAAKLEQGLSPTTVGVIHAT
jgi:hypothetical protein